MPSTRPELVHEDTKEGKLNTMARRIAYTPMVCYTNFTHDMHYQGFGISVAVIKSTTKVLRHF